MIFQNAEKYASFNTKAVQLVTFAVLLFFCWVASRGLNPVKETGYPGGNQYVCHEYPVHSADVCCTGHQSERWLPVGGFQLENLIPHFDWKYFSSLSILVFAVGGCEKISPYVNKVEDPSKGFPKSMILQRSW